MIVDLRTYTLFPDKLSAFLDAYAKEGWPIQLRHLGRCDGFYVVEIGVQNQVVHLWPHANISERMERRERMRGDPVWNSYRKKIEGFFLWQENRILLPTRFWSRSGSLVDSASRIVDLRTYTLRHGNLARFLDIYENEGRAIQERHWGNPIGYYQSETGPVNQIVHLWAHEDHAHRAARREVLLADHDWRQYMSKALPLFQKLENMVVRPAPFWSK